MTTSFSRHRSVTPEEQALWHEAMRGTQPLRRNTGEPAKAAPPPPAAPSAAPAPGPAAPHPPSAPPRSMVLGRPPPAPPPLPALVTGVPMGIDRRTDERLRRGQRAIDARLDLHGLSQAAAHHALSEFIYASHRSGRRCLLVITGKGSSKGTGRESGGQGGGILRAAVPRWVAEPGLRSLIVALHHAQPRDGGEGALYILLRRRRP